MYKIAVLVSGSGSNLQALLDAAQQGKMNAEIVLVVSDRAGVYALERAANHKIDHVVVSSSTELLQLLKAYQIDLVVLAGYLSILPPEITKAYHKRILNIHPSLIPKYCGKGFHGQHVHNAVLLAGETVSGATVHYVDSGIDTGEILLQQQVPVLPGDTAETLAERVLAIEHELIVQAVDIWCKQKGANVK